MRIHATTVLSKNLDARKSTVPVPHWLYGEYSYIQVQRENLRQSQLLYCTSTSHYLARSPEWGAPLRWAAGPGPVQSPGPRPVAPSAGPSDSRRCQSTSDPWPAVSAGRRSGRRRHPAGGLGFLELTDISFDLLPCGRKFCKITQIACKKYLLDREFWWPYGPLFCPKSCRKGAEYCFTIFSFIRSSFSVMNLFSINNISFPNPLQKYRYFYDM